MYHNNAKSIYRQSGMLLSETVIPSKKYPIDIYIWSANEI